MLISVCVCEVVGDVKLQRLSTVRAGPEKSGDMLVMVCRLFVGVVCSSCPPGSLSFFAHCLGFLQKRPPIFPLLSGLAMFLAFLLALHWGWKAPVFRYMGLSLYHMTYNIGYILRHMGLFF